jgi:hypothetical protein
VSGEGVREVVVTDSLLIHGFDDALIARGGVCAVPPKGYALWLWEPWLRPDRSPMPSSERVERWLWPRVAPVVQTAVAIVDESWLRLRGALDVLLHGVPFERDDW